MGMNCIAETPCTDQTYLDWLLNNQSSNGAEGGQETNMQSEQTQFQCSSNDDCAPGLFCYQLIDGQGGTCGECQLNGMGCAVEEFCRISGCQTEQDRMGVSKCYTLEELDRDCEMRLNDSTAKCSTEFMMCESQAQTVQQDGISNSPSQSANSVDASYDAAPSTQPTDADFNAQAETIATTSSYQNPSGNTYFCGITFEEVTEKCLTSKPCPSSIASDFCAEYEGCFSVPSCTAEYESVTMENSLPPSSLTPSMQSTNAPSPEVSRIMLCV